MESDSDHATGVDSPLDEALRQLGADILDEPIPERLYRALARIDTRRQAGQHSKNKLRTRPAMDHRSFRDLLVFSIGFEISRHPDLLRRILKDHVSDDAREQLAKRVLEHLELCGFTIDESSQMMKRRRPPHGHG